MNESTFGAYETDSSSTHSMSESEYDMQIDTLNVRYQEDNNLRHLQKISFMTWNIEGLSNKLFDKDFVCFVSSCDFVCLTETFLVDNIRFGFSLIMTFFTNLR